MNKFLFLQLSQEILMLVVEIGAKIINSVAQKLNSLTSSAGYSLIINKPTNTVNNSCSASILNIVLIQNNVISKHGVDVSIFEKYYHNFFGKIDICIPLQPPYACEVWGYSKANAENITKAISSFE